MYLLGKVRPWYEMAREIMMRANRGTLMIEVPGIVRSELLIRPLRAGNGRELRRVLNLAYRRRGVETVGISDAMVAAAAEIRAVTNLKLMDALVVASAAVNGCDAIVGNDEGFSTINRFVVVPALAARRAPMKMPSYLHLDNYV